MDKTSIEYFMCHMTQEEFEIGGKGKITPYQFNLIYQPERLSEKTYCRNEDGTYPLLDPMIGSDSLTSMET